MERLQFDLVLLYVGPKIVPYFAPQRFFTEVEYAIRRRKK
jgi:hypothetical protein